MHAPEEKGRVYVFYLLLVRGGASGATALCAYGCAWTIIVSYFGVWGVAGACRGAIFGVSKNIGKGAGARLRPKTVDEVFPNLVSIARRDPGGDLGSSVRSRVKVEVGGGLM